MIGCKKRVHLRINRDFGGGVNMRQRALPWIAGAAVLALIGMVSFFVASKFSSDGVEGQSVRESADWIDDLKATTEPIVSADAKKARFRGELGDFRIVGQSETDPSIDRLCSPQEAKQIDDLDRIGASELSLPERGDVVLATECPDGTINYVEGAREGTFGSAQYSRSYFTGKAIVRREAPRDRLELTSIDGYSALLEKPLDLSPFPALATVIVIERLPSSDRPGVMVAVDSYDGVEAAIGLLREITR